MHQFQKSNALDASELHPDIVLRYFNQGVILWMPRARWAKMMRHLESIGHPIQQRGRGDSSGVTFQKTINQ